MSIIEISIVIPLYNKEKHISDTLGGVFRQTYEGYEIIVVNDGSTDGGAELVASLGDERVRLINQANSGASSARNRGVSEAKNDFVAFLDADDIWHADYLGEMAALIERYPDAVIWGSNYTVVEEGKEAVLSYPGLVGEVGTIDDYFVSGKIYTPLWTSAVIVDRRKFIAAGGFDTSCRVCEDIDLWCRLALSGTVAYINRPLAVYHRDGTNMLSRSVDTSYYFPFLDVYADLVSPTDPRYGSVVEYVEYRKYHAVSFALFTSNNRKEARAILRKIRPRGGYLLKYAAYAILSVMPTFVLRLYRRLRSKMKIASGGAL